MVKDQCRIMEKIKVTVITEYKGKVIRWWRISGRRVEKDKVYGDERSEWIGRDDFVWWIVVQLSEIFGA